jgi:hypothetical protein
LNADIVGAMLTVKELMLTDGTVAEPLLVADAEAAGEDAAGVEVDELDEDEQPAAIRAPAAARATQPSLGKRRNLPESRPPSLLLPSVIPHTLSLNAPNMPSRDTIHNRAPAHYRAEIVRRDPRNVPVNTSVKPLKKS